MAGFIISAIDGGTAVLGYTSTILKFFFQLFLSMYTTHYQHICIEWTKVHFSLIFFCILWIAWYVRKYKNLTSYIQKHFEYSKRQNKGLHKLFLA